MRRSGVRSTPRREPEPFDPCRYGPRELLAVEIALLTTLLVFKGGADSEAFQRLPDGSFFSPRNENHLVQSGERSLFGSAGATNPDGPNFVNVTLLWTGKDGDTIDFDSASSQECYASICSSSSSGYSEPIFKANHWSFPDGTKVSFSYTWSILAPSWTEPLPQCSGGDLGGSCIYVAPNTIASSCCPYERFEQPRAIVAIRV